MDARIFFRKKPQVEEILIQPFVQDQQQESDSEYYERYTKYKPNKKSKKPGITHIDRIDFLLDNLNRTFTGSASPQVTLEDPEDIIQNLSQTISTLSTTTSLKSSLADSKIKQFSQITNRTIENLKLAPRRQHFILNDSLPSVIIPSSKIKFDQKSKAPTIYSKTQKSQPTLQFEIEYEAVFEAESFKRQESRLSILRTDSFAVRQKTEQFPRNTSIQSISDTSFIFEDIMECQANNRRILRDIKNSQSKAQKSLESMNLTEVKHRVVLNKLAIGANEHNSEFGSILHYGTLHKQIGTSTSFHKRWVVLRGFSLFYYLDETGTYARGILELPRKVIKPYKRYKHICFRIPQEKKEAIFKYESDWVAILNNQICFKQYLRSCVESEVHINLVMYFQDLLIQQLCFDRVQLPKNVLKYIYKSFPAHNRLQVLQLSNCNLQDKDLEKLLLALQRSTKLETLDLSGNQLTHNIMNSIAELVKQEEMQWNTIQNLNLSRNNISDTGIEILCRALTVRFEQLFWPRVIHQLPFIKLELSNINLHDNGIHAISWMLQKVYHLVQNEDDIEPRITLDISYNQFTGANMKEFLQVVKNYSGIRVLNMRNCVNLDCYDLACLLHTVRYNCSIVELDIRGFVFDNQAIQELGLLVQENVILQKIWLTPNENFYDVVREADINTVFMIKYEIKQMFQQKILMERVDQFVYIQEMYNYRGKLLFKGELVDGLFKDQVGRLFL